MYQQRNLVCNSRSTIREKKKKYEMPQLIVLGKVADLTAGGSSTKNENNGGGTGDPAYWQKHS